MQNISINNTSCNPENTLIERIFNTTLVCVCYRGYHGSTCDQRYLWYRPILLTLFSITTLFMIIFSIWSSIRIRYSYLNKKKKFSLVNILLIFNIISCLLRILYMWLPSRAVLGTLESQAITLLHIALVHGCNAIWLAICLNVVGFWYDILRRINKKNISKKTRNIIIINSIVTFILTISGMIFIIITGNNAIGGVIILLPLSANIIFMIIYSIIISKLSSNLNNKKNIKKRKWFFRSIIIIISALSIYLFFNILAAILSSADLSTYVIISEIMFRLSECLFCYGITMSMDYNFNSLKHLFSIGTTSDTKSGTNTNTETTEDN